MNSKSIQDVNSKILTKTFINLNNSNINNNTSSHATSVGRKFYGTNSSLTPEVHDIGIYSASAFLEEVLKNTGTNWQIAPNEPKLVYLVSIQPR